MRSVTSYLAKLFFFFVEGCLSELNGLSLRFLFDHFFDMGSFDYHLLNRKRQSARFFGHFLLMLIFVLFNFFPNCPLFSSANQRFVCFEFYFISMPISSCVGDSRSLTVVPNLM